MAANSRREQILVKLETLLNTLDAIRFVTRKQPADVSELEQYPITQMPLVAIVAGLPVPDGKPRGRKPGGADFFRSALTCKLFCYGQEATTPDTVVSDLMDDLWALLHANQRLALNFVEGFEISPNVQYGIWNPYYSFVLECKYIYNHTTGGI